MISIMNCRELT